MSFCVEGRPGLMLSVLLFSAVMAAPGFRPAYDQTLLAYGTLVAPPAVGHTFGAAR